MPKIIKSTDFLKIDLIKLSLSLFTLWILCLFTIIMMDVLNVIEYFGIFILALATLFTSHFGQKIRVILSGINGEKKTENIVKKLPSEYTVFINTLVEFEGKVSETDLIIVGNNGVFVIEVKNHTGQINGNEIEREWTQFKVTKNGGKYVNKFYNPIRQVKTHVYRLSSVLKEKGYNGWIQPVVFFSNKESVLNVKTNGTPVFSEKGSLLNFIKNFEPNHLVDSKDFDLILSTITNHSVNEK